MHKKLSILALEHPYERLVLSGLCMALASLVVGYLYFVLGSVIHIIERKEASVSIERLQSELGVMEQEYFALSESVDPAVAPALGLAPIVETDYVYRPGNAASAGSVDSNAI